MSQTAMSEIEMLPKLRGSPTVDVNGHIKLALGSGRSAMGIVAEAVRLMRGPGKLSGSEYLYYRLWETDLELAQKRAFVGKKAQDLMHTACNDRHWYQTAADKILFQAIMMGMGLPVPETLAVTQPLRWLPGAVTLSDAKRLGDWLRDPAHYPLFAKPAGGKYSLSLCHEPPAGGPFRAWRRS